MEDDDWAWPEEKPISSSYYNSATGGIAPPPKKLGSKPAEEDDDPSRRITQVRNYSWSDDTNYIRIYVPVPGVVREGVSVEFGEDFLKLHATTPAYGQFTMALTRLYDAVDVSKVKPPHARTGRSTMHVAACTDPRPHRLWQCFFKVLERKERVTLALAKFPPPNYGDDAYVNFKPWYKLHHDTTSNIDALQQFEDARLQVAYTSRCANPCAYHAPS